jgi:cytochrome c oxidase subunit 3
LGLLTALLIRAWQNEFTPGHHAAVEITGLYWHFVDIVWIFLCPLLYLIERHR